MYYTKPLRIMSTVQIYDAWPIVPSLHEPTAPQPAQRGDLNHRFLAVMQTLGLTGYAVAKGAGIAEPTLSYIRSGKQKPAITLVEWLLNAYPQVDADYLLRGIGGPLRDSVLHDHEPTPLTGTGFELQLGRLRWYLREEVYPALEDDANLIYDEQGELIQHPDVALAIHLHREFVSYLGENQSQWWDDYWDELLYLCERFYTSSAQLASILGHPQFIALLHAYNQTV
ncbi:hypothetical protein FAES_3961 [Fibrella aestuarina BUZ 2]|uniref:HTH cro/C1-type domain-containing protein n=2 Tax=Fibrella TaxID=861914 RepID=I0KCW1_9BACT|nr:hypothetical protein FAES_3961 [Fibrella aestuarina BUZ 2]